VTLKKRGGHLLKTVSGHLALTCGISDSDCCPGVTATQADVDFDGDPGSDTCCNEISGTYILDPGVNACERAKFVEGPYYQASTPACATSHPDACRATVIAIGSDTRYEYTWLEYIEVRVVKFTATTSWAVFVEYQWKTLACVYDSGGVLIASTPFTPTLTRWRQVVSGCPEPGTYELDALSLVLGPGGADLCTANFTNGPNVTVTFV
jgi:hypothetical protein